MDRSWCRLELDVEYGCLGSDRHAQRYTSAASAPRADIQFETVDGRSLVHPIEPEPVAAGRLVEADPVIADQQPDRIVDDVRRDPYVPRAGVTRRVADRFLDDA